MATQFLGTRYQSFKDDGTVNAGGSVYFYETGTSTAKTTYSDSALSVANANPVVLNSAGAADIWYTGDADVTVKDSAGTTIDTYTSINPAVASTTNEANLIANGSFEEGADTTTPTSWVRSTPYSGGTSVQDTDSAHGLYSWKFISTGNGGGIITTEDFFAVGVGRPFNLRWFMKSSVADIRNVVEILWYDDAYEYISASTAYDNSATNSTSWEHISYVATPVATSVFAKIRITGCHSSDATAGTVRFDGVMVDSISNFGYGQVWTAVTGSRAINTNYQNTTGYPIQMSVYVDNSGGVTDAHLDVGPTVATMTSVAFLEALTAASTTLQVMVPPGHYYSLVCGGGVTFTYWMELR